VGSVKFGGSTATAGSFPADGLVGLGGGAVSLVMQLGGAASLGRRFSYCLVPHSVNTSSALNFGALANVTEPGAASTPLVAGDVDTYYTVVLDSVKVGNKTVASAVSSRIIVDSGTTLTFLDTALMGPLVDELSRRCSRRMGCCICATRWPGGRWKPERESQITSINISRSPSCSDNHSTYVERIVRYRNAKISCVTPANCK
jgi:hypothetical protein